MVVVKQSFDPTAEPKRRNKGQKDKEFYADLDRAKKRFTCFSCSGCLGILILILLAAITGILFVIALTGFEVPLMTKLVYKPPTPIRVVAPAGTENIDDLIEQKLMNGLKTGKLILTEQEITAALREPSQSGELALKQGQVSIDDDQAEIYGQVTLVANQPMIVRAIVVPSRTGNSLELKKLYLGNLNLPIEIARSVAETLRMPTSLDLTPFGISGVDFQTGALSAKAILPEQE
ncbi:hypothetical protein HYW32_02090 [Candidatus Berkelbacteria bacterium]|nr:hypothetical protein [Candidatus Berkelbacteria bacterium]